MNCYFTFLFLVIPKIQALVYPEFRCRCPAHCEPIPKGERTCAYACKCPDSVPVRQVPLYQRNANPMVPVRPYPGYYNNPMTGAHEIRNPTIQHVIHHDANPAPPPPQPPPPTNIHVQVNAENKQASRNPILAVAKKKNVKKIFLKRIKVKVPTKIIKCFIRRCFEPCSPKFTGVSKCSYKCYCPKSRKYSGTKIYYEHRHSASVTSLSMSDEAENDDILTKPCDTTPNCPAGCHKKKNSENYLEDICFPECVCYNKQGEVATSAHDSKKMVPTKISSQIRLESRSFDKNHPKESNRSQQHPRKKQQFEDEFWNTNEEKTPNINRRKTGLLEQRPFRQQPNIATTWQYKLDGAIGKEYDSSVETKDYISSAEFNRMHTLNEESQEYISSAEFNRMHTLNDATQEYISSAEFNRMHTLNEETREYISSAEFNRMHVLMKKK